MITEGKIMCRSDTTGDKVNFSIMRGQNDAKWSTQAQKKNQSWCRSIA